jgi:RNA polymerase sigma-70 factor, ECF subfamily
MDATSHTLLQQIQANSAEAWPRLDQLYRPFLYGWFRRQGLPHAEAEDLCQEVLLVVARELPGFDHSGRAGAFRHWLRAIALHQAQSYWRSRRRHARAAGGSDAQDVLERWPEGADGADQWDRDHDRHVLQHLLHQVAGEVEPKTLQGFRRLALEGAAPESVAAELGMTVGAVYIAKSRVLRRLRDLARGLIDDSHFS